MRINRICILVAWALVFSFFGADRSCFAAASASTGKDENGNTWSEYNITWAGVSTTDRHYVDSNGEPQKDLKKEFFPGDISFAGRVLSRTRVELGDGKSEETLVLAHYDKEGKLDGVSTLVIKTGDYLTPPSPGPQVGDRPRKIEVVVQRLEGREGSSMSGRYSNESGKMTGSECGVGNCFYGSMFSLEGARSYLQCLQKACAGNQPRELAETELVLPFFIETCRKNAAQFPGLKDVIGDAFRLKAQVQEKQGHYRDAANTIRESHAWNADPQNISMTVRLEDKKRAQADLAAKVLEGVKKIADLSRESSNLAREKASLVEALLKEKRVSPDSLRKLQEKLADLNRRIAGNDKEVAGAKSALAGLGWKMNPQDPGLLVLKDPQRGEITLNYAQTSDIRQQEEFLRYTGEERKTAEKAVSDGLVKLSQKSGIVWDGLEKQLEETLSLQNKILAVQNQLLGLFVGKNILERMNDLKAQLKTLLVRYHALFGEIQDTFMNAGTFNQLSQKEAGEFIKRFLKLWDADKLLEENQRKINNSVPVIGNISKFIRNKETRQTIIVVDDDDWVTFDGNLRPSSGIVTYVERAWAQGSGKAELGSGGDGEKPRPAQGTTRDYEPSDQSGQGESGSTLSDNY